jgi:hypothetical protein
LTYHLKTTKNPEWEKIQTQNIMSYFGKKVNEVFQTKEYAKFKLIKGNRLIKNPKIKKLVSSMSTHGWVPGSYVVVNNKWEIIDGQHRVLAAMQCNIPIVYTMEKKSDEKSMRTLNTGGDNWQMNDHLHGLVEDGNPHYIKLQNLMKEFPELKITECLMLCKNGYTAVPRGTFENGEFTTKDMNVARTWGNYIMRLKPFAKFFNTGIFVRALIVCLGKECFNFEEFIHKIELRPTSLVKCGTREQYIELFENIYNYRRSDKVNLRY